jgi:hypothetical protein
LVFQKPELPARVGGKTANSFSSFNPLLAMAFAKPPGHGFSSETALGPFQA